MYGKTTRIFFGFMAFIMVVGYPVLLLTAVPSFQQLFLGQQSAQGATESNVGEARERVVELRCGAKPAPKGERLADCKEALQELGAGYRALATPNLDEEAAGDVPANQDQKIDKSTEAFELLVRIDPEDEESREFLASSYAQVGQYAQALPMYEELVQEQPRNADLVFALANTAQASGDNELALSSYRSFIKLAPQDQRVETAKEAIDQIENPEPAGGLGGAGGNLPIDIG